MRTDGQTDMTNLTAAFHNFAESALKKVQRLSGSVYEVADDSPQPNRREIS
jgi:hypothetical protein